MPQETFHILLVDDDDKFSQRFRQLLTDANKAWDLSRSRKPETALKKAAAGSADMVFLSLTWSDVAPDQCLEFWFEHAPALPVVVLLSKHNKPLINKAKKSGAWDYLIKDEELELLLPRCLQYVHERSRLQSANFSLLDQINTFVETSGLPMIMLEAVKGKILEANEAACRLYQYSEDQFTKIHLNKLEIGKATKLEPGIESWLEASSQENGFTRNLHVTKDGELRFVETRIMKLPFRGTSADLMVVMDFTESKRQEDEILFLQQFNTNILDNLPLGLMVKTAERRIVYQNLASNEYFGLLVGKILLEETGDRPELHNLLQCEQKLIAGEAGSEARLEWEGKTLSLTEFQILDSLSNSMLIVQLVQDISEREQDEQDLFRIQRMEAVGILAGGIAHDFNNLLSGILGYANLIQAISEDDEQIVQYAQVIEETCTRASDLTHQLLHFSRHRSQSEERFNLNAIIRYAGKMLRHSMKKSIRLVQRMSSKDLIILGDPTQIEQMVINLVLNANETMSDGTVTLSSRHVQAKEGNTLAEEGIKPGYYGVINIHDTGRSSNEKALKSMFDPDYLENSSEIEPLGIKLSVAYAIIRSHGGAVDIETSENEGNNVTVYLPIALDLPTEAEIEQGKWLSGNETILVIDDEEVIRNLMLTSLSQLGYRVLVASGAEDGTQLYEIFKSEIDLILLDLSLPGESGVQVFKKIRSINPEVRVIVFAGSGSKHKQKLAALEENAPLAWINKPIKLKRLSQTIRDVLD